MKIRLVWTELYYSVDQWEERTDWSDEANSRFSQFREKRLKMQTLKCYSFIC